MNSIQISSSLAPRSYAKQLISLTTFPTYLSTKGIHEAFWTYTQLRLWIIQQTSPWATTCKHRPPSTSLFFPFHIDHVRTNSWCLLRWLRRSLNASQRIRMSNCATRSLLSAYELYVLSFFCYCVFIYCNFS